jgi:hypothetical protein
MKALRNHRILLLVCLLCSIFIVGCGSSNDSNKNSDNGNGTEQTPIQVGEWSGIAEFGQINFTVSPEGTSLQEYMVSFQDYTCGITTRNGSITVERRSGLPINNRRINFEITLSYDDSSYIVLEGTFNDAGDAVSGEFSLYDDSDVCSGTWSASPGGGGDGNDVGDDAEQTPIQVGEWSGAADFGQVNFTVSSEGTSLQEYTVAFQNYTCGIATRNGSITVSWESNLPINNRRINFEITLSYDDSSYIVLEGTFNDAGDAVSGEFSLYDDSDVCSGTWRASPI